MVSQVKTCQSRGCIPTATKVVCCDMRRVCCRSLLCKSVEGLLPALVGSSYVNVDFVPHTGFISHEVKGLQEISLLHGTACQ